MGKILGNHQDASTRVTWWNQLILSGVLASFFVHAASAKAIPPPSQNWQARFFPNSRKTTPAQRGPPSEDWDGRIPLMITNRCDTKMWPGIATQSGTGPGTGGFELKSGDSRRLWVSPDWQGRVWGRTNCTVDGDSCSCDTGDCFHKLDCEFSGATPATLAEFNLEGGVNHTQTFYDISLVDGYNIPLSIKYMPSKNTTFIPPNLTNVACIATSGWLYNGTETGTYYTNSTYPVPLEFKETNKSVRKWCPWPLLAFPPKKPGDGVYPYPDDNVERPDFSPCNSACSASGKDQDCCVGKYHDPKKCRPSLYSKAAKAMCPDAYSYAFDDQKSTFIVPKGGGWEVVMCPAGRSTNILSQLGTELSELASLGSLSEISLRRLKDADYIKSERGAASEVEPLLARLSAVAVLLSIWFAL